MYFVLKSLKFYLHYSISFINAKRAREVNKYKNAKQKLHRTIAAIWYNKNERNNVNRILRILKQSTSSWRFYSSYNLMLVLL